MARLPRFSALRPFGARYAFCRLGFSFGVGYDAPFLWVARRGAPSSLVVIKAFQIYKTRREVEDKGIFEYLIFEYLIFEC